MKSGGMLGVLQDGLEGGRPGDLFGGGAVRYLPAIRGFLRTTMTESPRRNILEMYRSLLTGLDFFFPLPLLGTSVHISLTFSRTILQCLGGAKMSGGGGGKNEGGGAKMRERPENEGGDHEMRGGTPK